MALIAEMITDMTQQLPVFEEYRALFPTAYEIEEPLRELYFDYVNFCIDAVLFLKSKRWSKQIPIFNQVANHNELI